MKTASQKLIHTPSGELKALYAPSTPLDKVEIDLTDVDIWTRHGALLSRAPDRRRPPLARQLLNMYKRAYKLDAEIIMDSLTYDGFYIRVSAKYPDGRTRRWYTSYYGGWRNAR